MVLSGLIGLLVGGAGHIGKKLVEFGVDYLSKGQEIKLLKAKGKGLPVTCAAVCNFNPKIYMSQQYGGNTALETKEPKKFLFVMFMVALAAVGVGVSLYFQIDFSEGFRSKREIAEALERLELFCYELLGFLVSWTLTGSVVRMKR